ncbi:MAG: hypothetical protein OHK0046_14020 [Anaerolineae bacterium]
MTNDLDQWEKAQDYPVQLDIAGKIIDFLDSNVRRENNPEERIRQRMVQVLYHEFGYPRNQIALERSINIGRDRKRIDIGVYASPSAQVANEQGQLLLIGETKAPNEREPDGQLLSYLNATSAQGGFWTNGNTIQFYRKTSSGLIEQWLGIPKYGETWDSIGQFRKSDLISPIDLKVVFRRCHNALYRSGIDSEDIALDIVRIILAKIEDESSNSEYCDFRITPEEFNDVDGRNRACNRVRYLFKAVKERYPTVFSEYEEITASDRQLSIVISFLQPYALLEADYDVIGTAYEVYVASHLKGERGQYFTNRLVVNMMVDMADPSENDIVLDPACGSGGFLVATMNHMIQKLLTSSRSTSAKQLLTKSIYGNLFGIDTTPKLVKVAKTNMLLSKDGHVGIIRGNSLSSFEELPNNFLLRAGQEKPTLILTNPPFGAGSELRVKETSILKNFVNGRLWTLNDEGDVNYSDGLNATQGVPPEILFLERCIQWVKPGGIVGIVMAKGQLDNKEALAARKYLFDTCRVLAVINLHEDTFQPFVGARASVIFLRKKNVNEEVKDYRIFMAISNRVGQTSRGEPIFKKDAEGKLIVQNGTFALDEDLSDISVAYKHFLKGELKESEYRFSISINQIKKDSLSLNPVQYLPAHNAALQYVLSLGENDDFEVHTLGTLAKVFNGPRFKRPYADLGIKQGPTIRKYFTGTALTQLNSDNIKYLDTAKASPKTQRDLEILTIYKGYILVSDSGTLGRVTYALSHHDGHVATNNLIRIVIDDVQLRAYVYQFLQSPLGQHLILKNAYGTNQEHLEPEVIAEIPIPVPKSEEVLKDISSQVIESLEKLEASINSARLANDLFNQTMGFGGLDE